MDNDVLYVVEDVLDVAGVGGAGDVGVHLLAGAFVLVDKLFFDIFGGFLKVLLSPVFWEADGEWNVLDLLGEDVPLVEEEDDRSVAEPLVVTDLVEEAERLLHTVGGVVFVQFLVVRADSIAEDHCRDILEAVHPLLPL